jgi:hypothetical protein
MGIFPAVFFLLAGLVGSALLAESAEPIPGDLLVVRGVHPFHLKFRSQGDFSLPGPAGDPTVSGWLLRVNGLGVNALSIKLPASGWTALGTPAGSLGFRYRQSRSDGMDPCRRVTVQEGRIVASCVGFSGFTESLATGVFDLPMNGNAWVSVWRGTEGRDLADQIYCGEYDASYATRNTDRMLVMKKAPAPAACE